MKKSFLMLLLAAVLIVTGCTPNLIAPPNPTAGPDLAATADVLRTQVASTVVAMITSTAAAAPTNTPAPSETPIPATLTPTATVVTPTAPPTVIPTLKVVTLYPSYTNTPGPWQCSITKQVLKWGQKVPPGVDMDARWTVKNIGTEDWEAGSLKYQYLTGSKLYAYDDTYTVNKAVNTGQSTDIIVDMIVPKEYGYYHMEFALVYGDTTLCILPVDIHVTQ